MKITHMTLTKAAHDAVPAPPELREIDDGINAFLSDHITGLREMTSKRKTPPGRFTDPEAQNLFHDLFSGSAEAFLAAADSLAKRLIARMDGRSAKGLLICLRAHDDHEHFGGVLKMQVVSPNAAVLEELASGEMKLSAVRDLLDRPGELQKGALSTSWLAENRIMVGDQLGQDATYFPEAFGIKTFARPSNAVAVLFTVLDQVAPNLAGPVAEALPKVPSGDPKTVLSALEDKVPGLTPGIQATVAEALESQTRPVASIDTSRAATQTIKVGGIKITGPVSEMRQRVWWQEKTLAPDGEGWTIFIDSPAEPRRTHP